MSEKLSNELADRNISSNMLNRNTYGLAGSLLLVQRKAKERQRQGWKNCNVTVNHIRDISTSTVRITTLQIHHVMFCYVMLCYHRSVASDWWGGLEWVVSRWVSIVHQHYTEYIQLCFVLLYNFILKIASCVFNSFSFEA